MLPPAPLGDKIFQWLVEIDEQTCRRVAAAGCPWCGGPLHRGDYPRKPRGGLIAVAGEVFTRRFSLCCARDGCRHRATPPSVRFLGRRVYLGVAVVLASIASHAAAAATAAASRAREVRRATGIPTRTVARWRAWWQTEFPSSPLFEQEHGRFMPPLDTAALPASLVERFVPRALGTEAAVVHALGFVAPLTTTSVPPGSRFVRVE